MNEHQITIREQQDIDLKPTDLLSAIATAVVNPAMDVEKMERLLAMHERIVMEQRKTAFMAAMSRLQAKLPQIKKDGRIVVKGTERSRYAKLEDIDVAIKPLLAEEGFAFTFNTDSKDAKLFTITATLLHSGGHAETRSLVLPIDSSDFRSTVQSIGSTVSYGKRQLIKLHLNIVERDEDTDGVDLETISEEQAKDLETAIKDVKMDRGRFLVFMGVGDVREILKKDLKKAANAIDVKRRNPR